MSKYEFYSNYANVPVPVFTIEAKTTKKKLDAKVAPASQLINDDDENASEGSDDGLEISDDELDISDDDQEDASEGSDSELDISDDD